MGGGAQLVAAIFILWLIPLCFKIAAAIFKIAGESSNVWGIGTASYASKSELFFLFKGMSIGDFRAYWCFRPPIISLKSSFSKSIDVLH